MTEERRAPRLRFQLPLDGARLLRARERVRDYLRTLCPDEELVDDVVLCIEEACTNAIRHSKASEDMDVSLAFRGRSLIAEVRDRGHGFDVSRFDPHAVPDLMAQGGRGLFLIARLMDEMSLRVSHGLHVHMVKRNIADTCSLPDLEAAVLHGSGPETRQGRVRALLEEIDEAFVALDWEYRIVHANEAAARIAGVGLEDLLARPALEVWPQFRGGDAEANLRDAMELGMSSVFDWLGTDGRWREFRLYPTPSGVSVYVRDIEVRKRAELAGERLLDELRRSEERFRATFEQAAVGVVHVTLDGRYERVNERFCELVGYRRAEFEHLTFRDITHPDDVEREQHYLDALFEGSGTSYTFEKRYVRKDGAVVWASLTMSLLHDSAGAPDATVAVVQDVGAQKRAAETMRRYELLSDQARDIMLFVREKDGAVVEANRAAEKAYGYSREELLGLTVFDLRADGRREVVHRQMLDAWRDGVLFQTTHRRADGSTFPVEVSSRGAVSIDHEPVLLSVVRDVSEREALMSALASERDALASVMANTSAQVALLDQDLRFLLVNEAFLAGDDRPPEALIGRSVTEMVDEPTRELFEQSLATGRPVERLGAPRESEREPERGVTYWDWRVAPVAPDAGTAQGFVLSRTDVTERVRSGLYAEGLSELLESIGESRDPDELARVLAEGVSRVLDADSWSIWEYDGRGWWTAVQHDETLQSFRDRKVNAGEAPFLTEAYRTGGVVALDDHAGHGDGRSLGADAIGARSLIVAPLDTALEPFTTLLFSWQERPRTFTRAEIDLVARAAATTTAAVNDARLYRELAERERFAAALNDISTAITSLLDDAEILDRVTALTAEALGAESSSISMLEEEAWVPRFLYELSEDVMGVPIPVRQVAYANIGVEEKRVIAVDDCETDPRVDLELQRSWSVRSVMMAPLIVRGAVTGAIFLNYHTTAHAFSEVEVQFAGNAASIISSALETARLYQSERYVATTLQEAFVHPLPEIPGIEMAVTAARAYEPDLVGGDLYDAFELDGGRVAILVGDVEGKGVRAAGLAETVRSAVRALALVDASPGFILGKANELLLRQGSSQFVTAALMIVDPSAGEAVHASAGHPPALLLSGSDCAELATGSGTPLGAFDGGFPDQRVTLRPDDVVVLYTDGLTEMRRDGELFGVQRALEVACELTEGSLDDLVNGLRDAAVAFGGEVRDDMQIVAFRAGHPARPA